MRAATSEELAMMAGNNMSFNQTPQPVPNREKTLFDMSTIGTVVSNQEDQRACMEILESFSFLNNNENTNSKISQTKQPNEIYDILEDYSTNNTAQQYMVQTIGEKQAQQHQIRNMSNTVLASFKLFEAAQKVCSLLNNGKTFSDTEVVNVMIKDLKFQKKLNEMQNLDRNSSQFKALLEEAYAIKKRI